VNVEKKRKENSNLCAGGFVDSSLDIVTASSAQETISSISHFFDDSRVVFAKRIIRHFCQDAIVGPEFLKKDLPASCYHRRRRETIRDDALDTESSLRVVPSSITSRRNEPRINYSVEAKDRKYVPQGDIEFRPR